MTNDWLGPILVTSQFSQRLQIKLNRSKKKRSNIITFTMYSHPFMQKIIKKLQLKKHYKTQNQMDCCRQLKRTGSAKNRTRRWRRSNKMRENEENSEMYETLNNDSGFSSTENTKTKTKTGKILVLKKIYWKLISTKKIQRCLTVEKILMMVQKNEDKMELWNQKFWIGYKGQLWTSTNRFESPITWLSQILANKTTIWIVSTFSCD